MSVIFDKTVDYAQRVIDLTRQGAPDYKILEALAQRQAKQDAGYGNEYMDNNTFVDIMGIKGLKSSPVVQEKAQGVVELKPDALFDPNEFLQGGNAPYGNSYGTVSSGGSEGLNKIMGYVIVGLVGIALLDRFMNSSKK